MKVFFSLLTAAATLAVQAYPTVSHQEVVDDVKARSEQVGLAYQEVIKNNENESLKYKEKSQAIVKQAEFGFKQHSENLKAEEGSLIEQIIQNSKNLSRQEMQSKSQGLLVFVSFSMPKELLLQYKKQIELYGGRMVIRGLIDNDFKKTIAAMDLGNNQKLIVDIDPMLFKEHKIEAVPAIVLASQRHSDKFSGSISVVYALEEVALRGDAQDLALSMLRKVKG